MRFEGEMHIHLVDIWPIAAPENYKLHFARWNGENQPLEVWARDKREWQGWQEHRPARDDFNRPFIFSLVQFYHEPDIWLFGGVFRVLHRHSDRCEVELAKEGDGFLGRLKLRSTYRERATRVKFENHYPGLDALVRLCRQRPWRQRRASRARERSDAGILPQGISICALGVPTSADA
jgi:hypothetical protein